MQNSLKIREEKNGLIIAESSKNCNRLKGVISFMVIIDLLHNYICLKKLLFLASLSLNFSAICTHMTSKFIDKSAQK